MAHTSQLTAGVVASKANTAAQTTSGNDHINPGWSPAGGAVWASSVLGPFALDRVRALRGCPSETQAPSCEAPGFSLCGLGSPD
jgi:hypothetical protein